ncbi:hypothetical protein [Williamsia limnetica]|uniref:hypothetical protein n=1 Tax=Williamsia limnetica TaxID=882452 RepID=UPI001313E86B|nr:hypothetical protein [Williamsia limnetica]
MIPQTGREDVTVVTGARMARLANIDDPPPATLGRDAGPRPPDTADDDSPGAL